MALGWKPNVLLKGPIPLQYLNNQQNNVVEKLIKQMKI
jgi:hypothetical protein